VKSRGEARRLIEQGGVKVDGEKVTSTYAVVSREQLCAGAKVKYGKKAFHKALLKM
jgi:tyrosyl-tRNA synthetase